MRTINGTEITQDRFAFDDCHKFYLIETPEDEAKYRGYGYNIYPIEDLPFAWLDSCPLRFILSADLKTSYVDQFEPAWFEGWDLNFWVQDEVNGLAFEQQQENERW